MIGPQVASLCSQVRSCGVGFKVWYKKNANGEPTSDLDFTSLNGDERKKVLKLLPQKLTRILPESYAASVVKLWVDFSSIYSLIASWSLPNDDKAKVFSQIRTWMEDFLALHDKHHLEGYAKRNVTPYMHILLYHVPALINRHGSIKPFSGQGVEKNNDDAKKIFYRASNKTQASLDILRHDFRSHYIRALDLSDGRPLEQPKRAYRKRRHEYWSEEIFAKRRRAEDDIAVDI